jgi:hypothetical protein
MVEERSLGHPGPSQDRLQRSAPETAQTYLLLAGDAIVDLGAPLSTAARLGPDSRAGDTAQVTGFSVMQAKSADELTSLLDSHPHLHLADGSLEALEFIPMPGS